MASQYEILVQKALYREFLLKIDLKDNRHSEAPFLPEKGKIKIDDYEKKTPLA